MDEHVLIPPYAVLRNFVDERHASMGSALIYHRGTIWGPVSFGAASFFPEAGPPPTRPLYDLASVTKVVATTTAILLLLDQGTLRLDDRLGAFWPQVPQDKQDLTVRQLLTHTAGLEPWLPVYASIQDRAEAVDWILQQPLKSRPGSEVAYSCMGFIVLGMLVEHLTGQNLAVFVKEHVFDPLGMAETMYNPPAAYLDRIPYTEWCPRRRIFLRGIVHDENAQAMGGISGNAGLFSTLEDLAAFARCLLERGQGPAGRLLSSLTVEMLFRSHTAGLNEARSLGWLAKDRMASSGGDLLSGQAIGHTGFTGTSLWIDPALDACFILLTNRVHPQRENPAIVALRPRFHNAAAAFLAKQ